MTKPKPKAKPKTKSMVAASDPAALAKRDVESLLKSVRSLTIEGPEDQAMMESLLIEKVKPKEQEVVDLFETEPYSYRSKKASFDQVSKARRSILSILEKIEEEARSKLSTWYREVREAAEEKADEERLRLQKLEAKRIKKTTGEVVDPKALIVPEVEVEGPEPSPGITIMKNWGYEIPDKMAFVAAVAAGRIPLSWVVENERLIRETAKGTEAPSGYPEVIFRDMGTFQVRKG